MASDAHRGTVRHHRFGDESQTLGRSSAADAVAADAAAGGGGVSVVTLESPGTEFGSYTWPSSVVLAHYVWARRAAFSVPGVRVIELGAGTALPGLLAAKLGAAVTLTDYTSGILKRCRETCALNQLAVATRGAQRHSDGSSGAAAGNTRAGPGVGVGVGPGPGPGVPAPVGEAEAAVAVAVVEVAWGRFTPEVTSLAPMAWILGADVLYDPHLFDDLFATVAYLLAKNPGGTFVTAYQNRSADRSLDYHLSKWGLVLAEVELGDGEVVPQDSIDEGLTDNVAVYEITRRP